MDTSEGDRPARSPGRGQSGGPGTEPQHLQDDPPAPPRRVCRNAPPVTPGGVTTRPVRGLTPSRYALARRREDERRALVRDYAEACRRAAAGG